MNITNKAYLDLEDPHSPTTHSQSTLPLRLLLSSANFLNLPDSSSDQGVPLPVGVIVEEVTPVGVDVFAMSCPIGG